MKESDLIIGLMAAFPKEKYAFVDLTYLTKPFKVAEGNLRTHLSRVAKKGDIQIEKVGREAFYSFSEKGSAITANVAYSFKSPDWKKWKDSWWGISYSLPSSANKERYKIVKKMTAYRFALLHGGFWIRPYNTFENIDKVFGNSDMKSYLRLLRFQPIKAFTVSEIQKIWNINEVNKLIKQAYSYLNGRMKTLEKLSPEKALVEKMETGASIINALFKDPMLPYVYLPKDWKGDKLRKLFTQWDKTATEISKPYWLKIY